MPTPSWIGWACLTIVLVFGGCAASRTEKAGEGAGASCGGASIVQVSDEGMRGGGPLACVRRIRQLRPIITRHAFLLCQGARSVAPAECFHRATRRYFLVEDQALVLCRCAKTVEPARCFRELRLRWGFVDQEAVEICSPTVQEGLLFNCRPRAF